MQSSTVFITGGSSGQGLAIVNLVFKRYPSAQVYSFSRNPVARHPRAKYLTGDITSAEAVRGAVEKIRPNVVFHCAALQMRAGPNGMPTDEEMWNINYEGSRIVLEESRKVGVKAFVFTSSASVVQKKGKSFAPVSGGDETWPIVEKSDGCIMYSTAKADADRLIVAADDPNGMRTCSLRPALIYGEEDQLFLPALHGMLLGGVAGTKFGTPGNQSVTYSENGALSHVLAAERLLTDPNGVAGEAFYISDGDPVSFYRWAEMFWTEFDRLGAGSKEGPYQGVTRVIEDPDGEEAAEWLRSKKLHPIQAWVMGHDRWVKIDKAREQLGYKPTISTAEGVKKTAEWYVSKLKQRAG